MGRARTIFCIDLDAFYVSVERRRRPALVGRPVVVGGAGPRAVVAAASYEARAHGVRSAMPMVEARRRLRDVAAVAYVAPNMDLYERESAAVRAILDQEFPVVEAASIDEFYADATGHPFLRSGAPIDLAARVAQRIRKERGLPCSIGIGASRLVAKIATDEAKPAGLLHVFPGREAAFLAPLPVERIPGVGPKTLPRLRALGIERVGDAAALFSGEDARAALTGALGPAHAAWLLAAARGEDPSPVEERPEARSVGHEETFDCDVGSPVALEAIVADLAERVAWRLRAEGLAARTVQIKLRYGRRRRAFRPGQAARDIYETVTRAASGPPTQDGREIASRARALFRAHWRAGEPLRLLGVSVSRLGPPERQRDLFEDRRAAARDERLAAALDGIRGKFGFDAIAWAAARRSPEDASARAPRDPRD